MSDKTINNTLPTTEDLIEQGVCGDCGGTGFYTQEAPDNHGGISQWEQPCECKLLKGEDDSDMSGAE